MSNYRLLKLRAKYELSQLRNDLLNVTESTEQLSENRQLEIKNRVEQLEIQYCL